MLLHFEVSMRQACQAVNLSRSSFSYTPKPSDDEQVVTELSALVEKHPSIGFWKCFHRLRRKGYGWNHKRVYRVYTQMKLNIRRRARKRLPARVKQALFQPEKPNQVWSLDFVTDSLWDGTRFRILNVIDDFNREVLAMEIDTTLPSLRVIRVLERIKDFRGIPEMIRIDNGPEFISNKLDHWSKQNNVELAFIQPSKPTQNAYAERFNGSLRAELLNAYVFKNLREVRQQTKLWQHDYNQNRPHEALNNKTPRQVLEEFY